jgi:hypothetical protein
MRSKKPDFVLGIFPQQMEREPLFDLGTRWSRPPHWLAQRKRDRTRWSFYPVTPEPTEADKNQFRLASLPSHAQLRHYGGRQIWIITEADRSNTSLRFPKVPTIK